MAEDIKPTSRIDSLKEMGGRLKKSGVDYALGLLGNVKKRLGIGQKNRLDEISMGAADQATGEIVSKVESEVKEQAIKFRKEIFNIIKNFFNAGEFKNIKNTAKQLINYFDFSGFSFDTISELTKKNAPLLLCIVHLASQNNDLTKLRLILSKLEKYKKIQAEQADYKIRGEWGDRAAPANEEIAGVEESEDVPFGHASDNAVTKEEERRDRKERKMLARKKMLRRFIDKAKKFSRRERVLEIDGKPVEFYPKAPDREANDGEKISFEGKVKKLVVNLGLSVELDELATDFVNLDSKKTIFWKYFGDDRRGALPDVVAIKFDKEKNFLLLKTEKNGKEKISAVSAVELEYLKTNEIVRAAPGVDKVGAPTPETTQPTPAQPDQPPTTTEPSVAPSDSLPPVEPAPVEEGGGQLSEQEKATMLAEILKHFGYDEEDYNDLEPGTFTTAENGLEKIVKMEKDPTYKVPSDYIDDVLLAVKMASGEEQTLLISKLHKILFKS